MHPYTSREAKRQTRGYNGLKRQGLAVFARCGDIWLTAPIWARLVGHRPVRSASSYLKRLHGFGLLLRRTARGQVRYRISQRGRRRLDWLLSRSE
jgi:hypothetical protein